MENTNEGTATPSSGIRKHTGSCHCGAVRFEVELDVSAGATRCNCSICTKVAQASSIVKPRAFVLLSGEEALGRYDWRSTVASRYFCKHCGVHCYGSGHVDVLGGDFVSVNWNCLDDIDLATVKVMYWDGRHDNWEVGPRDTPWPSLP